MESILICEKSSFSRKFLPAEKLRFSGVKPIEVSYKVDGDNQVHMPRKKAKVGALIMCCLLILCMFMLGTKWLTSASSQINSQLISVIGNLFAPKDFGKIKFVDTGAGEIDTQAFSLVSDFSLPFVACTVTEIDETFLLTSPGEITIKCAMDGVVESIVTDETTFKKTITVSHSFGLKSIYYLIDTVSVNVGDKVLKNTILGISNNGTVALKINYNNKIIKGLTVEDGELSFS